MKGRFGICLLCGFAAECALCLLIAPRMGWLAGLTCALAVTVVILFLYLLLTRGVPMAGERGRLFTDLWVFLVGLSFATQEWWGRSLPALLASLVLLVVQVAAALWLDWKNVRCSNCGKHLPLFGDMDRCSACRTTFTA